MRKENSEGKEQIRNFQQEIDELHTKIEILLVQQEDLRARAAAEIEAAMKLVEQSHFHQHSHSFHGDPSGVATPLDDSTVHAENESQPLEESLADKDVDPSSIPANRLQEALYLDKQLSVDSKIPTTQNSRDGHEAKQPQDEVPNLQPSASRLSMSVFPTKKEVVTLTPVPITMNAQFFEFERPSSKKNPRPAPVSTSAPSEPSLPLTPTPTIPIQSSQPLPSPSAYLQLYDDRPVTPELHPLVVSPPEVAVQIRRTSDPIDYLTASQALEKQQRLSLRLHAVATPEPTSSEQPMAQQIDTSAKSLIGASSHSPQSTTILVSKSIRHL